MNTLYKLKHRANINTFLTHGKTVIIYEDHRYILNILKYAMTNEIITKPINIISLDYHSDSYRDDSILNKTNIEKIKKFELEEFWNFVEFRHSYQDDDWLVSGMEYGFINNAAMLFVRDIFDGIEFNKQYQDIFQNNHCAILIDENSTSSEFVAFNKILSSSFILDIDLDFASKKVEGKNVPLTNEEMDSFFLQKLEIKPNSFKSLNEIFADLVKTAEFITICKESEFCGGYANSDRILKYLDKRYFNNSLT